MIDDQLKKNSVSLTILQIGHYVVPLFILPYLSRVLGVEGFGQFGFATAFTVYFVLIVEWGFNLSSTREVSIKRSDRQARTLVFWETLFARVILSLVSGLLFYLLIRFVPRFTEISTLLWLGMLQVLAASLSTAFYYQGTEKMTVMSIINLGVKITSIPLIIIFVSSQDQVTLAFGIQSACFLIASLINLAILLKSGEIDWIRPRFVGAYKMTKTASSLFLSYAASSLYTNSNIVILGLVSNPNVVGQFVAGFVLVKAVVGLTAPFAQAVFPRASQELSICPDMPSQGLIKVFLAQGLFGLTLSLALFVFMPWGVTLFYGDDFQTSVSVVGWLSTLPLVICLASVFGMQILVPLGKNVCFSTILLVCGVLNCFLIYFLGIGWGAVGAAVAVLITECVILLAMAISVKKYAPNIWQRLVKF